MKKSNDFKKILMVLSTSAVAIFILHYIMYEDMKAKNEKISNLQYDLSILSDKQDYLILTDRALENLAIDLDKAQASIVPKGGDIKFIENIEALARSNGLTIEIDSLGLEDKSLPSPDLTVLHLEAKTEGSWLGTYTFLAEVESLPFKIKVGRSSMVRIGGSGPSIWDNTLSISVLKYK